MKPLISESLDDDALRLLGRASVQIVHDLKNQLNGLKLYATFLRKRLEKGERASEELETINKLIAGLDRMAKDVSLITRIGRPLQLKKQAGTDLETIVRDVANSLNAENVADSSTANSRPIVVKGGTQKLAGEFDPILMADAVKWISLGALKLNAKAPDGSLEINLKSDSAQFVTDGVIEWKIFDPSEHDPFHSLAGSNEIQLSLAARVIEAHGGSAKRENGSLCVRLPLPNTEN
jgi:light-regulated signal transduction histidine kinase (bacteriophytochrome)